jgi:hypothetical protein
MNENSSIIRTSGGPGVPPDVEAAAAAIAHFAAQRDRRRTDKSLTVLTPVTRTSSCARQPHQPPHDSTYSSTGSCRARRRALTSTARAMACSLNSGCIS